MTIKEQLLIVRDRFAPWARANGAKVEVASDPYHIVYLLVQAPGAMRACVMFHSDAKRGEYEESGMVDRTFWVVVSRGKGMKIDPGASLTEGVSGGGKAMFDLVEEARELIRGISFEGETDFPRTTEVTPNFKGAEPFAIEGYLTDSYRLEFSIGVQLPAVDVTANAAEPDPETA